MENTESECLCGLIFFLFFKEGSSPSWTQVPYIADDDSELLILLPLPVLVLGRQT